jgi:hypothetical protein
VDKYVLLRFAHLIGLMLMSAGLIGVFVPDMRSRQVRDVKLLAQAVTFIAVFYDGLVVPGALLLLASGTWLIISYYGGWQFLKTPLACRHGDPEPRSAPHLNGGRWSRLSLFYRESPANYGIRTTSPLALNKAGLFERRPVHQVPNGRRRPSAVCATL